MNRKLFKKFEKVCKSAWEEMSKTGDSRKPKSTHPFENCCPACHIAIGVVYEVEDRVLNCRYCPIDKWRNIALDPDYEYYYGNAVCDSNCEGTAFKNQPYYEWKFADEEHRKIYAKEISKMSWTYLPEYKDADIPMPEED